MRNMTLAVIGLSTLIAGCAMNTPGRGVDEPFAARWGCDIDAVADRADELKEPAGRTRELRLYTPQVGWDACELMAHVGQPREHYTRRSNDGVQYASWWYKPNIYRPGQDLNLIELEREEGKWVVASVEWRSE